MLCRKIVRTPEKGTAVLIAVCALRDQLQACPGLVSQYTARKGLLALLLASLGQESELCQEVFFGDMNGSINAVNWRDCADAFLSDKRRLCPPPELVILLMFLSHWDSGEQGSVFFPPWHHKQHGCPY